MEQAPFSRPEGADGLSLLIVWYPPQASRDVKEAHLALHHCAQGSGLGTNMASALASGDPDMSEMSPWLQL